MREGAAFLRRLVPVLARGARVVNIDWDEKAECGPPARRRVPRARFLRDARRAGLRLIAEHRYLPHQYFVVLRRTRSEEHTSELQSHSDLVCRLLLEKKKKNTRSHLDDLPDH